VPKKIQQLIRLCLTGACTTIAAAADRVGLHQSYCYKALRQPHVRKHISDATQGKLNEGSILAAGRLVGLINAKSEHVSMDASKHALALAGYQPPQDARGVAININNMIGGHEIVAGYVVDLGPPHQSKLIQHEE
jgi:hypothetical protein